MKVAKNVLIFGSVGLALSLITFALSSVAPCVFGWFTAPFWILPEIANLGAHDVWSGRLFLPSATLCYGVVAFLSSQSISALSHSKRGCLHRADFLPHVSHGQKAQWFPWPNTRDSEGRKVWNF